MSSTHRENNSPSHSFVACFLTFFLPVLDMSPVSPLPSLRSLLFLRRSPSTAVVTAPSPPARASPAGGGGSAHPMSGTADRARELAWSSSADGRIVCSISSAHSGSSDAPAAREL
eukprot:scaffold10462_cov119-Isochrysis_galbana.AAC.5